MNKIGITGIIGSGKSEVSRIFEMFGVPVYFADPMAKKLLVSDKKIRNALKKKYGDDIYLRGSINRKKLAEIIFNSAEERLFVNNLVHPVVIKDFLEWSKNAGTHFTAIESALVFDSDLYKHLDWIIHVKTSQELRLKRTMERDNISKTEVENKIKLQNPEDVFDKGSDFIINNDEKHSLILQTLELFNQLKKGVNNL